MPSVHVALHTGLQHNEATIADEGHPDFGRRLSVSTREDFDSR